MDMAKRFAAWLPEIAETFGLGVVAYGLGMAWLPLGVIAAGCALCFLGFSLSGDKEAAE